MIDLADDLAAPAEAREKPRRTRATWRARLLWLPVAWSVALFGAVYPWAYTPLLVWTAGVGAYGWWSAPARHRRPLHGLAIALGLVATVPALQLVPLPASWLQRVSPATYPAAQQLDIAYAAPPLSGALAPHAISIAPAETAKGLAMFAALAVFLVGTAAMMPRVRLKWLTRRLGALGLALALFGIVQRATFNGRLYWVFEPINVAANAFGPFVNRNHFAGWMLMTGALSAGYVCSLLAPEQTRRRQSWRRRLAAFSSVDANRALFMACAVVVMSLSLVWTMSRSGIAAFAAATALLSLRVVRGGLSTRRLAIAALLLAVAAFALSWKGLDSVFNWYSRTDTLQWRLHLWRDTMAIVRDFPWLGTGLDTYGASTLLYPTSDPATHPMEAHNDYIQIVSEGGAILAAAAAFAVVQLARAIRGAFAEPQTRSLYWIRVGATIGLTAIAIQELSDFSLQIPANAVLFALLAAIAVHRPPSHERPLSAHHE